MKAVYVAVVSGLVGVAALLAMVAVLVLTADRAEADPLPEHPHILIQRPVVEIVGGHPTLVDYRRCIDLANNQALGLNAHHAHLHFGTAGEMLFFHAGHAVAPAAPFPGVPWTDCESFANFLPLPLPGD